MPKVLKCGRIEHSFKTFLVVPYDVGRVMCTWRYVYHVHEENTMIDVIQGSMNSMQHTYPAPEQQHCAVP
jgi:hypothetical protein